MQYGIDVQLIDSHCHLDAAVFDGQRDQMVEQARAVGVTRIVVPAIACSNFDACEAMRQRYGCWLAFGLHPLYVEQHLDDHLTELEARLAHAAPIAVGEIGLDAWQSSDLARQETLFIEQLKLARKYNLPVILHQRHALDRVLKYLRRYPVVGGIAHAFNGSSQQAAEFIGLGFKLGFGGAMTYSGSTRIRRLAASLPLSALVLETDAPDMRPEWAQDRPNQPANMMRIAMVLAELRSQPFDKIAQQTADNTVQILNLRETNT